MYERLGTEGEDRSTKIDAFPHHIRESASVVTADGDGHKVRTAGDVGDLDFGALICAVAATSKKGKVSRLVAPIELVGE